MKGLAMRRLLLTTLVGSFAVLFNAVPGNRAMACWCNRVYTSYYVDPCVSCTTVPACSTTMCCPTSGCAATSCYTTAQHCYMEPQVTYRVVTRLEPQTFYVRRSYYDPFSCCDRSYYVPATQFVSHSYQVPVTTYVQRCYVESTNACPVSPNSSGSDSDSSGGESRPSDRNVPGPLKRP